jgi:hypothetical protein
MAQVTAPILDSTASRTQAGHPITTEMGQYATKCTATINRQSKGA